MLTRSEEELSITTRRRAVKRARLTRFVTTETVTSTVEVHHEQVRLDYEPATEAAGQASDQPRPSTEEWIVLYDEEVVVTTRRVPRERVRLRVHSVTENREISEVLSRERVEISDGQATIRD